MAKKEYTERTKKIKVHVEYFNSIRDIGFLEACKQGIIKDVGCSVSGGKDSLATLLWAKNNLPETVTITGSYVKTPLENTDIDRYIKYVSKETGIKINIYGYTDEEKEQQIEKLIKSTKENGPPFVLRNCEMIMKEPLYKKFNKKTDISLIGIRWKESQSRTKVAKLYRYHYNIYYHPIITWSKEEVFHYIKENGIKLYPVYKYADRMGCSLCPLGMGKKKCSQIYFISKMRDSVDWEFYHRWYEEMEKFKYDRSGVAFVKRANYLKSNYRKLKQALKQDDLGVALPEYNPPNCGWFSAK